MAVQCTYCSLGLGTDGGFKRIARSHNGHSVCAVLRILQTLVMLYRVLGIHGQPHRLLVATARQANGELTSSSLPGTVLTFLAYCSGVSTLSMMLPSCISPQVPRDFPIGHHTLEVAYAAGQRLHLPQTFVHLLQPVADLLEGLTQPLLQRGIRFSSTVRRISSSLVALSLLNGGKALVQCAAQLLCGDLLPLRQPPQLLAHRILQHRELMTQLLAIAAQLIMRRSAPCGAHVGELLLNIALERVQRTSRGFGQRFKAPLYAWAVCSAQLCSNAVRACWLSDVRRCASCPTSSRNAVNAVACSRLAASASCWV